MRIFVEKVSNEHCYFFVRTFSNKGEQIFFLKEDEKSSDSDPYSMNPDPDKEDH